MLALALTLEASRTFSGGVRIGWTPTLTSDEVAVTISIGGEPVWYEKLHGDETEGVDAAGDNWSIEGSVETKFEADGVHGKLNASLAWKVEADPHLYKGLIGYW